MGYQIDENGYGWRVGRPPFFGTRLDLLRLYAAALLIKVRHPHIDRKRRKGSHPRRARPGVPGSNWKQAYGPGSYAEWKAGEAAKRAARRSANGS